MRTLYILVPCLLLAGCGILPPDVVASSVDVINQLEANQAITMEQAEAMRQAILANTGEPWWMQLGKIVLEVGLAVAGVRMWRGPTATVAERRARVEARRLR